MSFNMPTSESDPTVIKTDRGWSVAKTLYYTHDENNHHTVLSYLENDYLSKGRAAWLPDFLIGLSEDAGKVEYHPSKDDAETMLASYLLWEAGRWK